MEAPKAFGPFEVRGELGRGAGGVVYVAWHPEQDRTVAVKLFSAAPKDARAAIARLRRDAQAAGALGHPNIAAVLGVGDHDGWPENGGERHIGFVRATVGPQDILHEIEEVEEYEGLNDEDKAAILGGNARRFYRVS